MSFSTASFSTVAIVGVGLIGGSVGLALRERRFAKRVIGIGPRLATLEVASKLGAVDDFTTDLAAGVRGAELIVLAVPLVLIVETARQVLAHCATNAIVTDCGSTKRTIVRALTKKSVADGAVFVGSHPLAGSEKSGNAAARADLFVGRTVVVTPGAGQTAETPVVLQVAEFWAALGAMVVTMSPTDHDRALAGTSHLPHVVASALTRATKRGNLLLTAGGWRDSTRIAAGDPELWTQIALDNRAFLLAELRRFEKSLTAFTAALDAADPRKLTKLFAQAKEIRDAVGS